MPDNIDLVAEVSGRSVWLLSNQSDYTHKHASTHTYKKNSIRATDSVIDFPVYLCVGQCRLMAHILYFNGCVSFHVSWNYCFFLTEDLKWSLWGLVLIPSVPANSSMWLLSWKELACACLFLTDSIRQLSRCSICQSVPKKIKNWIQRSCVLLLLFIQAFLAWVWVCVHTVMDFRLIII